jgi:hypothetical protein
MILNYQLRVDNTLLLKWSAIAAGDCRVAALLATTGGVIG